MHLIFLREHKSLSYVVPDPLTNIIRVSSNKPVFTIVVWGKLDKPTHLTPSLTPFTGQAFLDGPQNTFPAFLLKQTLMLFPLSLFFFPDKAYLLLLFIKI